MATSCPANIHSAIDRHISIHFSHKKLRQDRLALVTSGGGGESMCATGTLEGAAGPPSCHEMNGQMSPIKNNKLINNQRRRVGAATNPHPPNLAAYTRRRAIVGAPAVVYSAGEARRRPAASAAACWHSPSFTHQLRRHYRDYLPPPSPQGRGAGPGLPQPAPHWPPAAWQPTTASLPLAQRLARVTGDVNNSAEHAGRCSLAASPPPPQTSPKHPDQQQGHGW